MNQCRVLVVIGVLISRHEQTINIKANPHQRLKNVKTVLRLTLEKNSDRNNQCNGLTARVARVSNFKWFKLFV